MEANLRFWAAQEQRGRHFWTNLLQRVSSAAAAAAVHADCGAVVPPPCLLGIHGWHTLLLDSPPSGAAQGPLHFAGRLATLLRLRQPAAGALSESGKQAARAPHLCAASSELQKLTSCMRG